MVSRAVVVAVMFLATYILPNPVKAACGLTIVPCPYSCSTNVSGSTITSCCSDISACQSFQRTQGAQAGANSGAAGAANGALKVDPEKGCSGGINTALGCIPYDTSGFTSALLSFLAGTVGLIAIVVMLVATIMIMTGGDNAEQVKKGKELFTGGITGLFFIIFSVTILRIIAGDIIKLPGF